MSHAGSRSSIHHPNQVHGIGPWLLAPHYACSWVHWSTLLSLSHKKEKGGAARKLSRISLCWSPHPCIKYNPPSDEGGLARVWVEVSPHQREMFIWAKQLGMDACTRRACLSCLPKTRIYAKTLLYWKGSMGAWRWPLCCTLSGSRDLDPRRNLLIDRRTPRIYQFVAVLINMLSQKETCRLLSVWISVSNAKDNLINLKATNILQLYHVALLYCIPMSTGNGRPACY